MKARTPSDKRRAARRATERQAVNSTREQVLAKFGPAADERATDRRQPRTPAETERILRDMGIADRRRQDRRHR